MFDSEKILECKQKLKGAYVDKDGSVHFRLFTFSNVKNVVLQINKQKAQILSLPMEKEKKGIWTLTVKKLYTKKRPVRYRFEIYYGNGKVECVRDPYSMWQDSYCKWSIVCNHNNYKWKDADWLLGKNRSKVSRVANKKNKLKNISELSIYELHIGTITQEGTFQSAKSELKRIKKLGFNSIEIMPVENTYSFNWGYDGVDKFAPNHTYGKPDDLKSLVDYAHKLNLNVIMDIVPNHLGPDIAELKETGPYIEGCNDFGFKFNFEKTDNCAVREYIVNTALNWLVNYHCDGLRVDMTKYMQSDYTMKMMAAEVQYYCPDAFLIAEDGRDNDKRVTTPLSAKEQKENLTVHNKFINKICNNDISLENLGFDSEWDFIFHKQIAAATIGTWEYFTSAMENLDNAIKKSGNRVKYPMSHDEIGNIDGTRLLTKIFLAEAQKQSCIGDCDDSNSAKIYAHCAHKLIENCSKGLLNKMTKAQRQKFFLENYFQLSTDEFNSIYYDSVQRLKLALGKVYSCIGPKMIFQGDESINYSYFKFFRKFSIGREKCLEDKGYKSGVDAFLDSKMNNNIFDDEHKKIYLKVAKYMHKLNDINSKNPALTKGEIINTIVHPLSSLHAIHSKFERNEIFSISNFSKNGYLNNYGIAFPEGKWKEILNSDDKKYFATSKFLNKKVLNGGYNYISIPPYGIMFFKRIDIK